MFKLDPSKRLEVCASSALAEMFILMAYQHGAERLEFRTIKGEFRIAEIIGNQAFEYPRPPECMRLPIIEHLRTMFSISENQSEAENALQSALSTATARCKITDDINATLTLLKNFQPNIDVTIVEKRFWRDNAARQGTLMLLVYHLKDFLWYVQKSANQSTLSFCGGDVEKVDGPGE